jgi:predicted nucleic acid-binding protein
VISLVVDANVPVKSELPGEAYTDQALELIEDWRTGASVVHAPDLLPSELGSVLLRGLRRGRLSQQQALASLGVLLALPYHLHASTPLVPRSFEIADQHGLRIYDCFYVALAEREGIDLWTADERLCNALAPHFPFVRFIAGYVPLR